ncbi:putative lipoprotein [Leptospira borgpetersenii serovar Pomona str. 200901868]|uniref:Putative lipoprotein n=1 Tax=Leptospira borgpetersenii serovar Pomona str. 200901868 TaxID=1192866 RepID=M6WCM0_LEPBO|nr:putative lipoprotein [Leptospira borgpetersenii serovar Pomona str. 200901868]
MRMNVKLVLSLLFVFNFLSSCSTKKEDKNTSGLLLSLLFQDRVENYNRDVQIITHTMVPSAGVSYDTNYPDEDLSFIKDLIETEIARYPKGYFIKARAEKIVFTRNLTINSLGAAGGLSRPEDNIIFINISDGIKSRSMTNPNFYSASRLSKTIHHELTHSMDDVMEYWWDPKWESLNPPSFQYGSYDYSSFNPRALGPIPPRLTPFWNPIDGFVSEYATSNFAEDRADIGGAIQGRQFSYLNQICAVDPIVAAKVRLTIDEMNRFWPYPGAENTAWKRRFTEIQCN